MKIMSPGRIEAHNRRACEIAGISFEERGTTDLRYALLAGIQQVLVEEDLAFVRFAGTADGAGCEVYLDPKSGELVYLRVEGDSPGFDDTLGL